MSKVQEDAEVDWTARRKRHYIFCTQQYIMIFSLIFLRYVNTFLTQDEDQVAPHILYSSPRNMISSSYFSPLCK